jgi:hypothetical protein
VKENFQIENPAEDPSAVISAAETAGAMLIFARSLFSTVNKNVATFFGERRSSENCIVMEAEVIATNDTNRRKAANMMRREIKSICEC